MIPTVRTFIAGMSDTGKSTRAWHMYLARMPRRIIFDLTGEWESMADAVCLTVRDGIEAIRAYARRGRWTIVFACDPKWDLPVLTDWMIPLPDIKQSPIIRVGGAVILIDEADLAAPPATSHEHIRTLARRSRHAGLSVIWTTQRPENVSREVSAQCNHRIALRLSEPRAIDYMARAMGWTKEDTAGWIRWCQRHPHGGYWRDVRTGLTLALPEAGTPQRVQMGRQLSLLSPADAAVSAPQDRKAALPASASRAPQRRAGLQHPAASHGDGRAELEPGTGTE